MVILTKASQQRQNIVEIQKNWIFSLALLLSLSLSLSPPSLSFSRCLSFYKKAWKHFVSINSISAQHGITMETRKYFRERKR